MAISAVLAVGVAVEGYSAYNSHQDSNHYKNQADTVFGEQQSYEKQLSDLMANPSSVTKLPGYEFNFDQGATALSRQMAAGGFLNSGNQGAALVKYGQNTAMSTYAQQEQMLAQLSGITKASSPTDFEGQAQNATAQSDAEYEKMLSTMGAMAGGMGTGGQSGGMPSMAGSGNTSMFTQPNGYTINTPPPVSAGAGAFGSDAAFNGAMNANNPSRLW